MKAVLTESATLMCEVAQDTTEAKWYKDGKLLVSSRKFKIETVGKSRRLVVEQLEKKDAGEYVCEAAGQKLTFKLEPTGECSLCGVKNQPLWLGEKNGYSQHGSSGAATVFPAATPVNHITH